MAFFNQLKEKVNLASEKVVETTSTVIAEGQRNAEIKRKKNEIQDLQTKIDDLFRVIGVKVFESKESQKESDLSIEKEIEQIKKCYDEQLELYQILNKESKEVWKCNNCSELTVASNQFCPNCGTAKELG